MHLLWKLIKFPLVFFKKQFEKYFESELRKVEYNISLKLNSQRFFIFQRYFLLNKCK